MCVSSNPGLSSVVFAALSKAAEKQVGRDEIVDGSKHVVTFDGFGKVNDVPFSVSLDTEVKVGHGGMKASSVAIDPTRQMAYVFELIELAFGPVALKEIIDDMVAKFKATGEIPATDHYVDLAEEVAKELRKSRQIAFKGSVVVSTTKPPVLSFDAS
jgi:hypothetical protein